MEGVHELGEGIRWSRVGGRGRVFDAVTRRDDGRQGTDGGRGGKVTHTVRID